jgi:hypothetical protein
MSAFGTKQTNGPVSSSPLVGEERESPRASMRAYLTPSGRLKPEGTLRAGLEALLAPWFYTPGVQGWGWDS